MVAVRALQRRVVKLEKVCQPRSSPFTIWFGSIENFVDTIIIPAIQSELVDKGDMVDIVAAIRSWEADGAYDL